MTGMLPVRYRPSKRVKAWAAVLEDATQQMADLPLYQAFGQVADVKGPLARVEAPDFRVGDMCEFMLGRNRTLLGEVIGLNDGYTLVTPLGPIEGIGKGTLVRKRAHTFSFPFSDQLLGKVLNGLGEVQGPIKHLGETKPMPVRNAPPDPMDRAPIDTPLATGLRVIDSTMTLARGQRIAVVGPPGTGKSTLFAAITANVDVDVVVFGLIGERGREITEFITRKIDDETRQRLVVVAAPADRPALERLYAANTATAVAEGFRDQGKSVLLVVDSLTRVARAIREVGLAAGEPPTRRGYPASVFAMLPELIERPGKAKTGEITAIYSVLSEGDVSTDPIAEETRSLVDGHIVLDADVFAAGRFPAINVNDSLSRLMTEVVDPRHAQLNSELRKIMARYEEIKLLIQVGEYQRGQDPEADRAADLYPQVIAFLSQSDMAATPLDETIQRMEELLG